MPFAPKIRKDILQALEESILPMLRNSTVLQLLADTSYNFPSVKMCPIEEKYLSIQTPDPLQVAWSWKEEQMSSSRFPYLMFVYEGTANYKVGVTTDTAEAIRARDGKVLPGAYLLEIPAPAILYSAPYLPRNSRPLVSRNQADHKSIALFISNQGVRFHMAGTSNLHPYVSHSLQVRSSSLVQLANLYKEELEKEQEATAQALFFVMMSQLHRQLEINSASLANSAWPTVLDLPQRSSLSAREQELYQEAMDYIETQRNAPLTRSQIAEALHVSPDHLGRVFYAATGTTIMNYITHRRIEAAKLILAAGSENIGEVANLVGFSSIPSFSTAFKRIAGVTPSDYRRQHRGEAV